MKEMMGRRGQFSLQSVAIALALLAASLASWRAYCEYRETVRQNEHQSIISAVDSGWTVWVRDKSLDAVGFDKQRRRALTSYLMGHPQSECEMLVLAQGNEFAPENVADLKHLFNLRTVRVSTPDFDDRALESLCGIHALQDLHLGQTKITDQGMALVRDAVNLDTLSVPDTDVGDVGVSAIGACSGLRSLCLRNTCITDAAIPTICNMQSLRSLDLSETRITNNSVKLLSKMSWLWSLNVSHTSISEQGVAELRSVLDHTKILP